MSSSSRPRTRGQLAKYIENAHSELKKKRQCSSIEGKESDSSRKDENSVKKTRNAEGNGRKGKRKSDSDVDRVVRKKTQLDLIEDDDSDGFELIGEKVVENGKVVHKKVFEKKDHVTSSSGSENVEKNGIFTKNGVENGGNSGKKSSVGDKKKGKEKKCSNVVTFDISEGSKDDDDEIVLSSDSQNIEKDSSFMKGVRSGENGGKKRSIASGNDKKNGKEKKYSNVVYLDISDGSSIGSDNIEKDANFMKKGSKIGGKKSLVANGNDKKNGKEKKFGNVGSFDKVLRSGNQIEISDGSGDDDGIVFRDEIEISDSSLSTSSDGNEESYGNEESDGLEFMGEKKGTCGSSSSDSREDDGLEVSGEGVAASSSSIDEDANAELEVTSGSSSSDDTDVGLEFVVERNANKVSSSNNSRDSKSHSVSDVADSDSNSNPVNSGGLERMPQNDDFVNSEGNTSDSESLGWDSNSLVDQSDDTSMSELETCSEEEDDSDDDYNEDEPSSYDDSLVPYSSSDDNDVAYVSERGNGTSGEEEIKENDVFVEKTLRSGRKMKGLESPSDVKDSEYVGDRDTGKNKEDQRKGNGVFVEKNRRSRNKFKRMIRKTGNVAEINKGYRSDKVKSAETGLRKKKVPGKETAESHKKNAQCGKSTRPSTILEGDESGSSADENPEPLKWERSGEKKGGSKEIDMNLGKKTSRTAKDADLIRMLFHIDNIDVEGSGFQKLLPLKFRFEDELDPPPPPPEKSEQEKLIHSLFLEMELCSRASEVESSDLSKTGSDGISSKEVDVSPEACCGRGEHQSVLDEQIGIVCRFCGALVLDIKDILPHWYKPRSRRQARKYFGDEELPSFVNGEFQFHKSTNVRSEYFTPAKGTVWDLIPGFEKGMFPHQREAFEFLWKSIGGDIEIEKLPKSLSDGTGCIISHAPGTGKTRLAVVFLLSVLKLYPNTHPVIIAPRAILSTWEKEFVKWKVDIPFHNMNCTKLSGNETRFGGGTKVQGGRLAKLLSWLSGGGILGISYQLLGSLVSEKEKQDDYDIAIRKVLIERPSLLVLDEGHTPRNRKSRIWNAVNNVDSKRCIILSGTPYQNTFEELKNTLCLVDPSFHKMDKSSWKKLTGDGDERKKLQSLLDPYVNVHEGSLLQKNLPELRVALVRLHPTELQKRLMAAAAVEEKKFLSRTPSESLISVHPSALMVDKTKFSRSETFSSHKDKLQEIESDLDEGVKIKFVINLIKLADALGERVLIFSQYLHPLKFIKEQLKTRFSWSEGKEVLYMDGKLLETRRQMSISSFNNGQSEAKVLLASTRACSEGITLVGASRVVLLDTVWNPSVQKQAISRAYRLGQKKRVYVYRLMINEMEERQCELQAQKVCISKSIFSRVVEQAGEKETSPEDKILEQMLNLETSRTMFANIVYQPKESDSSEGFRSVDH